MDNIIIQSTSRINISNSDLDEKKYIIKSKNELSNKFMSMPFGTTRTRFQEQEMFDYILTFIDRNEYYNYELTIKRKINLCTKSIISLFPKNGWNNLIISNIKKYDKFNVNNIINDTPADYGTFKFNFVEIYRKIGIIVPCYGRHEYTKIFLESLKLSNLNDCILVLVDESLTKDVNEDKIKTNNLINDFEIDEIPIIKIFKTKHGNMNDSILVGLDILGSVCDYLMTIDSDTLIKTNWIDKTLETFINVENMFPNKNIVISGFNTDVHRNEKEYENFVQKQTIGGCHLCFKTELYYSKIRFCLHSHKWDTNIYNIINKSNGIICVTKPSVVEHIGEISSVRNEINNVKSVDF